MQINGAVALLRYYYLRSLICYWSFSDCIILRWNQSAHLSTVSRHPALRPESCVLSTFGTWCEGTLGQRRLIHHRQKGCGKYVILLAEAQQVSLILSVSPSEFVSIATRSCCSALAHCCCSTMICFSPLPLHLLGALLQPQSHAKWLARLPQVHRRHHRRAAFCSSSTTTCAHQHQHLPLDLLLLPLSSISFLQSLFQLFLSRCLYQPLLLFHLLLLLHLLTVSHLGIPHVLLNRLISSICHSLLLSFSKFLDFGGHVHWVLASLVRVHEVN